MEEKEDLNNFKIGSLPTLYYIPDFISDTDQTHLLNNIYQAPVSKWKNLKNRRLQNWGGVVLEKGLLSQDLPLWLTKITKRICEESGLYPSTINHVLINEYQPNQGIMPHQDGPAYFPVVAILSLGSPAVMDFTPHPRLKLCTDTSSTDVNCHSTGEAVEVQSDKWKDNHHPFSVLLMPRSLLIFKDEAYSDYLHGISDSAVQQLDEAVNIVKAIEHHGLDQALLSSDKEGIEINTTYVKSICRTTNRISLTCRLVPKVCKNLFKI